MGTAPALDPRDTPRIAAIVPCYRVREQVLDVLARVGPECQRIFVVDDACPEGTGDHVEAHCRDPRLRVLRHASNRGVGAAVISGYRAAIEEGCDVLVKLDGDGQMDPALLPGIAGPVIAGQADYAKGNRFYELSNIRRMPVARIIGNLGLSFMTKLSAGYWNLFDPTNGYTAIHAEVASRLPLDQVSPRYFFESDMLFHLGVIRAVVVDVPMDARYGDEKSSLRASRVFGEFLFRNLRNTARRIFYSYFLRDFSVASLQLLFGALLLGFGLFEGIHAWALSSATGKPTLPGTVMLAGLPILAGLQLILAFIAYDIAAVPRWPLHPALAQRGLSELGRPTPLSPALVIPQRRAGGSGPG